jgi:hypothetical protein
MGHWIVLAFFKFSPALTTLQTLPTASINTKGAKVARRSQDQRFDALLEHNDVEVDQSSRPDSRRYVSSCASWTGATAQRMVQ